MKTTARKQPRRKPKTKPTIKLRKTRVKAKPVTVPVVNVFAQLRERLGLTQPLFARVLAVSVRSLASLEAGAAPSEPVARRLTELKRLTTALHEVITPESLPQWLATPNAAFENLKPIEVIERGESDRLWEMVYFLRSGVAY